MERSPLQTRLKDETMKLHMEAENHPLMKAMAEKTITKQQLLRLFVNLRTIYDVVERRLLQPYIIKNSELCRTAQIDKDIAALASEMSTEELGDLLTPLECTDLWLGWSWTKPKDMLKAELYTRWLADLYGGRILAEKIAPYNNHVQWIEPSKAMADIRTILDITNIVSNEDDIVEEAIKVFDFHKELFTAIQNA
jgi:heme oxygenase